MPFTISREIRTIPAPVSFNITWSDRRAKDFSDRPCLVQEGVYDSLLMSRRRELHRLAASWFTHRDLVLRAEHLDRAGDPEAPRAYLAAARKQAAAYRNERALELADRET